MVNHFRGLWCAKTVSSCYENQLSATHHCLGHFDTPSNGDQVTGFSLLDVDVVLPHT